MGLYAEFSPEDFGFPSDFSSSTEDGNVYVEVDYSGALEAAADVFMYEATSLVPVDTGYLQSTISAFSDGDTVCFSADAEYAQYPEYGTWCQAEQPYFRPALQDAIYVFIIDAVEAISEAQDEFVSEMELSGAEGAGEKSLLGYVGDIVASLFIGILFFPFLIIGMELSSIMEEGNKNPTPNLSTFNSGGDVGDIDVDSLVEIT